MPDPTYFYIDRKTVAVVGDGGQFSDHRVCQPWRVHGCCAARGCGPLCAGASRVWDRRRFLRRLRHGSSQPRLNAVGPGRNAVNSLKGTASPVVVDPIVVNRPIISGGPWTSSALKIAGWKEAALHISMPDMMWALYATKVEVEHADRAAGPWAVLASDDGGPWSTPSGSVFEAPKNILVAAHGSKPYVRVKVYFGSHTFSLQLLGVEAWLFTALQGAPPVGQVVAPSILSWDFSI